MTKLTPEEIIAVRNGTKRVRMAYDILEFVRTQSSGATCDDCMGALGFPHQSASARFHDLVRSGCLKKTGKSRATRSGSTAAVHVVAEEADFKSFLTLSSKKRERPGLTPVEQAVLSEGMGFIKRWKTARTNKGREQAAVNLVNKLGSLANLS